MYMYRESVAIYVLSEDKGESKNGIMHISVTQTGKNLFISYIRSGQEGKDSMRHQQSQI